MNAIFTREHSMSRISLQQAIADVEAWERHLDLINRKVVADPDGEEGQRLEDLILRGQALIGSHATRLLGVDIARFDRARGVGL